MDARPRLLDQVREQLRLRHHSYRTEQQYLAWIRRFIRFHGLQHRSILGAKEIEAFLSHLAFERRVASSAQNQALAALLFLFGCVFSCDLPSLDGLFLAKRSQRLPVVLTCAEVRAVLG